MDDIAAELERLRPSEPGERLERRIEAALDDRAEPGREVVVRAWWLRWAPLAAALVALVALVALAVKPPRTPTAETAPSLAGVASTSRAGGSTPGAIASPVRHVNRAHYLVDAEDAGLIYTSSTAPWRKVTWEYLSASEWRDDRAGMTFQVLVPREETVVIPVPVD